MLQCLLFLCKNMLLCLHQASIATESQYRALRINQMNQTLWALLKYRYLSQTFVVGRYCTGTYNQGIGTVLPTVPTIYTGSLPRYRCVFCLSTGAVVTSRGGRYRRYLGTFRTMPVPTVPVPTYLHSTYGKKLINKFKFLNLVLIMPVGKEPDTNPQPCFVPVPYLPVLCCGFGAFWHGSGSVYIRSRIRIRRIWILLSINWTKIQHFTHLRFPLWWSYLKLLN